MSKISISGAATGTATFTIESPATNTNRTLTLPDATGTVALTSNLPTNSVMMQCRLNGDQTLTDATSATANFSATPQIQIGGTWDTTNKRFTADATTAGYYLVTFNAQFFTGGNAGYNASAAILKNGSGVISNEITINGADIRHVCVCVTQIVQLQDTDWVGASVYFDVNSGTPVLSQDSEFNLIRLIY